MAIPSGACHNLMMLEEMTRRATTKVHTQSHSAPAPGVFHFFCTGSPELGVGVAWPDAKI